jgi:hypothetical protein
MSQVPSISLLSLDPPTPWGDIYASSQFDLQDDWKFKPEIRQAGSQYIQEIFKVNVF